MKVISGLFHKNTYEIRCVMSNYKNSLIDISHKLRLKNKRDFKDEGIVGLFSETDKSHRDVKSFKS